MKTHDLVGGPVHEIPGRAAFVMTDDDRPAPSRPLSGCRLLVVEDDHIIRAALRSGLELHGSEVTAVADGVEALAHVMTSMPDVVVLDLALPRMNGEDFVAELRRRGLRRALRIVVRLCRRGWRGDGPVHGCRRLPTEATPPLRPRSRGRAADTDMTVGPLEATATFKTILVPLDGSELAARAIPYAMFLARAAKGALILFHASSGRASDQDVHAEMDTILDKYRLAEQLTREGVSTVVRPVEGDIGSTIVQEIAEARVDLVVMSTHGRGGLARVVHGSVADHVLHHAPVPVLLVTARCGRAWVDERPLRLLVPLDGSVLAEAAIRPALDLASAFPVEIRLLRAAETRFRIDALGIAQPEPASEADLAAARRYLEQTAIPLRLSGQRVAVVVESGEADEVIAQAVDAMPPISVVMATHGQGGLGRLLLEGLATVVTPAGCRSISGV